MISNRIKYIYLWLIWTWLIISILYSIFGADSLLFSTGDAWGIALKAYKFLDVYMTSWWEVSPWMKYELFSQPFGISYIIAVILQFLNTDILITSHLISWLVTLVWLAFLFLLLKKITNRQFAWLAILIIASNATILRYGTEPEKATFIVPLFLWWLYYFYKNFEQHNFYNTLIYTFFIGVISLYHTTWFVLIFSFLCLLLFTHNSTIIDRINRIILQLWVVWIFFGTYVYVSNQWIPSTVSDFWIWSDAALIEILKEESQRSPILRYINTTSKLIMRSNFEQMGIDRFWNWFRSQSWVSLVFLGIILAISLALFDRKQLKKYLIFLIPIITILFFFGIRREAPSHGGRYPYYINYLIIWVFVMLIHQYRNYLPRISIFFILILMLLISVFSLNSIANHSNYFLRWTLDDHYQAGEYISQNNLLDKTNKLLAPWRSHLSFWMIEWWEYDSDYIVPYGWWITQKQYSEVNIQDLRDRQIKYYLYAYYGSRKDMHQSMFENIKDYMKPVWTSSSTSKSRQVVLYELY